MLQNDDRCTHYDVLGLAPPQMGVFHSPETIKRAYHQALLLHHPDKSKSSSKAAAAAAARRQSLKGYPILSSSPPLPPPRHSVDRIMSAYRTLLDPSSRAEYDRSLLHRLGNGHSQNGPNCMSDDVSTAMGAHGRLHAEEEMVTPSNYETLDLDDLVCVEDSHDDDAEADGFANGVGVATGGDGGGASPRRIWYASCRCGVERAFVVTEAELERHADDGAVFTLCSGCSLWLKVEFEVED